MQRYILNLHKIDGGEIEKLKQAKNLTTTNKRVTSLPIVTEDEAKKIIAELQHALMLSEVQKIDMKEKLFGAFDTNDKVSIHELERVFKRKPLQMKRDSANKMARYVIESRKETMVEYNELAEEKLNTILEKLEQCIPTYTIYDDEEEKKAKKKLAKKLVGKYQAISEAISSLTHAASPSNIKEILEDKISLLLSPDEEDYIAFIMNKSAGNSPVKAVLQHLLELSTIAEPASETSSHHSKDEAGEQQPNEYVDMDEDSIYRAATVESCRASTLIYIS